MKAFFYGTNAATAMEYALIAALISIVIVASLTAVGSNVKALFETVQSALPA
jgi:pilus assembly protein Flp/PilA